MARKPKIVSRQVALRRGLPRYFTGKPCKRGHVAERFTSRCHCLECERLRWAKYDASPQGLARHERYIRTPKGRAAVRRVRQSPKGRERAWQHGQSPKGRERNRRYQHSPKG